MGIGQFDALGFSGRKIDPGIRAEKSIRAAGQKNLSWNPGRPSGKKSLSGHPGSKVYPGTRAEKLIQASGQKGPSGHPGRKIYPGSQQKIKQSPL